MRPSSDWAGVGIVALPAWVEHQPRTLLKALAAALPVIAGAACGLEDVPGVTTAPEGDIDALVEALASHWRLKIYGARSRQRIPGPKDIPTPTQKLPFPSPRGIILPR